MSRAAARMAGKRGAVAKRVSVSQARAVAKSGAVDKRGSVGQPAELGRKVVHTPDAVGPPVVAIVGRPNVGKSSLFNRFVGGRPAIVEDRPRTTRDRIYGEAEWNGRLFLVVDTGGLEPAARDEIELKVQEQARLALDEADVIVFVVDAEAGLVPADLEASELLRVARAPVIVAANKADNRTRELQVADFFRLGWPVCLPVSALHGRGTGDLLDAINDALPAPGDEELRRLAVDRTQSDAADRAAREFALAGLGEEDLAGSATPDGGEFPDTVAAEVELGPVRIAIVGRPNVGKSSLLNVLFGRERAIVSSVPGTTRDAIDTALTWEGVELVLIDTAGIRRRGRVASGSPAERYSTLRALRAIGRADVAILLIDAQDGLTAQDAHIAGYVVEEGRGLVLAINKWDLLAAKSDRTFDQFVARIRRGAPFLDFASVVSISAKTGQRVERVLEAAIEVWGARRKRIGTGELNRLVGEMIARVPPPASGGSRLKILYATQVGIAPPTFVFFTRGGEEVHFSYRRYLENQLRSTLGFEGTPIRLVFRQRPARSEGLADWRGGGRVARAGGGPGGRARSGTTRRALGVGRRAAGEGRQAPRRKRV